MQIMITALSQNNVAKILTFDNERLEAVSSFQQYNPVAISLDLFVLDRFW